MVRDERVPLCDSQLLLLRSRCLLCCSPADKDIAMKKEIEAAAAFLSQLAAGGGQTCAAVPEKSLAEFKQRLVDLLTIRFQDHWFPERPHRGQGYRCIRLNKVSRPDPIIERAAEDAGLRYADLNLPVELTLWVDPKEVCCRFGEQRGSCCTIASFDEVGEPVSPEHAQKQQQQPRPAVDDRQQRSPVRSRSNSRSPRRTPRRSPAPSPASSPNSTPIRQQHHYPGTLCYVPGYDSHSYSPRYHHQHRQPMAMAYNFLPQSPQHSAIDKHRYAGSPLHLTYVPAAVHLLNSWTVGRMVKV